MASATVLVICILQEFQQKKIFCKLLPALDLIHVLLDQAKLTKDFAWKGIPDKGIKERENSVETENLDNWFGNFGIVIDVETDEWAIPNQSYEESGNRLEQACVVDVSWSPSEILCIKNHS